MFKPRKDYGARVRIWDNGGKTCDRYTILPPAFAYRDNLEFCPNRQWSALASDAQPFHPQGFGQHTTAMPGSHLGKRIHWDALPIQVKAFARQEWPEYCPEVSSNG